MLDYASNGQGDQPSLGSATALMAKGDERRDLEHAEDATSSDFQDLLWLRSYEPRKGFSSE